MCVSLSVCVYLCVCVMVCIQSNKPNEYEVTLIRNPTASPVLLEQNSAVGDHVTWMCVCESICAQVNACVNLYVCT